VQEALVEARDGAHERQMELARAGGKRVLLWRKRLAGSAEAGMVLVFDDITRLLQRSYRWGRVAQRLAPTRSRIRDTIQLSAERLQHRRPTALAKTTKILQPTQTIVNQVAARSYGGCVQPVRAFPRGTCGRSTEPAGEEVLGLYESSRSALQLDLAPDLPAVSGDTAKLRQVIHNLLQNAEYAVAEIPAPRILVRSEAADNGVRLSIQDNGPGFPEALMARVFEPYVHQGQRDRPGTRHRQENRGRTQRHHCHLQSRTRRRARDHRVAAGRIPG
jgi:nitrogen fixation/metabolism regulation signal transduction histidine kinase